MIRISRGPEPAELSQARRRRLARAVLARRSGQKVVFDEYNLPSARDRLYAAQHAKCAYCERGIGKAGHPIEHFRPKQGADRGDPLTGQHAVRADRYWWLAWSWNNLFLSCATCNSATFKGNWFPLEPGSPELAIPDGVLDETHACFATGIERALLIDPAWDDPLDHITWLPLDPATPYKAWRAHHRTERGRFTIHILGLDGRNVDRPEAHIRDNVKPWVERVYEALERPDTGAARATWRQALDCLFAPSQLFHAVSHDALAYLVPAEVRARAELELPRPGAPSLISAAVAAIPEATADVPSKPYGSLPEDVILHLLAAEQSTPELILLICSSLPSTVKELMAALELSEQTVRWHCRNLVTRGELIIDAEGRYARAASSSPGAE